MAFCRSIRVPAAYLNEGSGFRRKETRRDPADGSAQTKVEILDENDSGSTLAPALSCLRSFNVLQ